MKERQKRLKEEISRIAKEQNVTERDVENVEDSMWKFVKSRVNATNNETEEHSNIYLRFLGTIFVAPNRIKRIKENIKRSKK